MTPEQLCGDVDNGIVSTDWYPATTVSGCSFGHTDHDADFYDSMPMTKLT